MNTLDLEQASVLLKLHPQTILQKARAGLLPAAKLGKCWVFVEQDLIDWIRSQYTRPRQNVGQGESTCSLKDQTANSGGIALPLQTAQQYANLLKPMTNAKRRS